MGRGGLIAVIVAVYASAPAAPFTFGSILVSNGLDGPYAHTIREYSRAGLLIQTISVPYYGNQPDFDCNNGMALGSDGRLHVYNGTFTAGVSSYDPVLETWETTPVPGLSEAASGGKIAAIGDYLFLPDDETFGAEEEGLVRFRMSDRSWVRIPPAYNDFLYIHDLHAGPDGLLYLLKGYGSPRGTEIEVYDPETLVKLREINLLDIAYNGGDTMADIAVRADGNTWINQRFTAAFLVDNDGNLLQTFPFSQTSMLMDFAVAGDGMMVQVGDDGHVVLYDSGFQPVFDFQAYDIQTGRVFVELVPVPEPASLGVLLLGALFVLRRVRR